MLGSAQARTLAFGLALAALPLSCGGGTSSTAGSPESAAQPASAAKADTPDDGSAATLDRARASLRGGRIDAEVAASIASSDAPGLSRARRLLAAIDDEAPVPVAPATPSPAEAGVPGDSPRIRVPDAGTIPAPAPTPSAAASSAPTKPTASSTAPVKPAATQRGTVKGLVLTKTSAGATLLIKGSSRLSLGAANQLASGRLHVVVEQASALDSVLSARPSIDGVKVTSVRRGQGTVQISLALDPGWSVAGRRTTKDGARVTFTH